MDSPAVEKEIKNGEVVTTEELLKETHEIIEKNGSITNSEDAPKGQKYQ